MFCPVSFFLFSPTPPHLSLLSHLRRMKLFCFFSSFAGVQVAPSFWKPSLWPNTQDMKLAPHYFQRAFSTLTLHGSVSVPFTSIAPPLPQLKLCPHFPSASPWGPSSYLLFLWIWLLSCCSVSRSRPSPCDPVDCSTPGFPVFQCLLSLFKPMSTESAMPSNHLILCRPLLLLPSIFPSIRVFSNESPLPIRWPKHWSFSFSISPSNQHPGLISFRVDWLDLLAVQGTLKSLLQHHDSKASVLQRSAFFMAQLSQLYMTTGKTTALTRWTFVSKVRSLLFNSMFRFVIVFLPRSKCLLISWLQSPSTVILEPKKRKSVTASRFSPFYLLWSDETRCHDLSFSHVEF